MAGKRRRGLSWGSMLMLAVTALVVAGCVFFLSAIMGGDLEGRTDALIRLLSEERLFEAPEPRETAAPAAASARSRAAVAFAEETAAPAAPVAPAAPAALPTATPVPAPVTITVAAAGTVYAPKAVRESVQSGARHDFTPVFEGLGDLLAGADLAIATLETTVAGRDKGFDTFNTAPELLDALRESGVDLLALATERMLDLGYEGLELTLGELTARGLASAGVRADGESGATMMRIGGVQVAVLAYTYGLSSEGASRTDGDRRAVAALMDAERMAQDIRQARVEGANVVIVLPHWGTKNIADTPQDMVRLARRLAEAGADIILGTHPNVPQGTERLTVTRDDGLTHDAVVCYSLGSLLTDARTPENTAGMTAHVSVTYDPATRRTTLGELYCTPVYIAWQRENGRAVYRIVDAEHPEALEKLTQSEREAARGAVEIIREATRADEQEGQG